MYQAKDYTYRVFWSDEDDAYIATAAEFPGLSSIEDTPAEALCGMVDLVDFTLSDLVSETKPAPEPLRSRSYSGKISLRMPAEQHRRVAMEAAEQGVSINQLLVSRV